MDIIFFDGDGYKGELAKAIPKQIVRDKIIIIQAKDDKLNRQALSKHVDILLDPHLFRRKDYMHQRDSGLNQVLCNLARENKIAIGFSFSSILNAKDRAKIIGRMIQNIKLCRKYRVKMVIGSFAKSEKDTRNLKDIQSFFKVLGMTGKEANLNFVKERLEFKRKFIRKGVMLTN
tara:strand:+ start:71 stop:595 length:525 start_codon:yes stop_codon:yes gene_type:complete